jgi:hypothetical protein
MAEQPEVTRALIYQELLTISKTLGEHAANFRELRQLLEGSETAPGMKIRLDRLEQSEVTKTRHFQYVWGLMLVMAGAVAAALLH